jgi:hypothetical protein
VISTDDKLSDDGALLIRHILRLLGVRCEVFDKQLANIVHLNPDEVWRRVDDEPSDLSDILDTARRIAEADGAMNLHEKAIIAQLEKRCGNPA